MCLTGVDSSALPTRTYARWPQTLPPGARAGAGERAGVRSRRPPHTARCRGEIEGSSPPQPGRRLTGFKHRSSAGHGATAGAAAALGPPVPPALSDELLGGALGQGVLAAGDEEARDRQREHVQHRVGAHLPPQASPRTPARPLDRPPPTRRPPAARPPRRSRMVRLACGGDSVLKGC